MNPETAIALILQLVRAELDYFEERLWRGLLKESEEHLLGALEYLRELRQLREDQRYE